MIIGILGAGKLGVTLAQLAVKAGYEVIVAGSGDAGKIALTVATLAPGATAATSDEVARRAEVIILALPLSKFRALPGRALAGKRVIDAMNYWWEVDGPRSELLPDSESTSEAVQAFLPGSRVVKALSHMGYHHLHDETKPTGSENRKAIAIAGDDSSDVAVVVDIVDKLGFDAVILPTLESGRVLEPGHPAFGANLTQKALKKLLN